MKNLLLIRHGKSSWNMPVQDFERPLTQKGVENSYKVANYSQAIVDKNALIWTSFAKRAAETCKIITSSWNFAADKIYVKKELYTFDLLKLEEIVKSCPNQFNNLIIFGHNGAITDFVNKFGNIYIENVPTSGLVSINFETENWSSIKNGITDKIIFPSHL